MPCTIFPDPALARTATCVFRDMIREILADRQLHLTVQEAALFVIFDLSLWNPYCICEPQCYELFRVRLRNRSYSALSSRGKASSASVKHSINAVFPNSLGEAIAIILCISNTRSWFFACLWSFAMRMRS